MDRKWNIGWGFTKYCNMGCGFCYSQKTRDSCEDISEDIADHVEFVKKNHKVIKSINWGTSENSLTNNWYLLVDTIGEIDRNIKQGVTSNGYIGHKCGKNIYCYDKIVKWINEIDVSLDYHSPEKHNSFRGNNDAYSWVIETLEFCRAENIVSTVVFVGTEDTLSIENIAGLFDLAYKYGAYVRLNILRPTAKSTLTPPSYSTVKKAIQFIIDNYQTVSLADPLFSSIYGMKSVDPSGVSSLRILPDGSVTPCTYLTDSVWIAGNILRRDLDIESFGETAQFAEISSNVRPEICGECKVVSLCGGGAKDRRILWYGSLRKPDPYCPFYNGDNGWANKKLKSTKNNYNFIHADYLPTLIFYP